MPTEPNLNSIDFDIRSPSEGLLIERHPFEPGSVIWIHEHVVVVLSRGCWSEVASSVVEPVTVDVICHRISSDELLHCDCAF